MGRPQEVDFWKGNFGDDYTRRNSEVDAHVRARVMMWAEILGRISSPPPASILEVGANIGRNIAALKILTQAHLRAVEPNGLARRTLVENGVLAEADVLEGVAQALSVADGSSDMVFTSGVLIHVHPDDLEQAVREIHRASARYIVCVEYFADEPEEKLYRGHSGKLFKRDFGGYYLDLFPHLRVRGTGFAWKRTTGLDNATWWVFEKPV